MKTVDEGGPTYGYEMGKKLKEKSNFHWDLSYSTVYEALKRMESKGLMERVDREPEDKKYYRITEKGKKVLDQKEAGMKEMEQKSQEMALGFLNLYKEIFEEEKFQALLEKITKEFDI